MAEAYILINTNVGAELDLLPKIRSLKGVVLADIVYGTFDLIVKVKATSQQELNQTVLKQFRTLDGIRTTMTLMALSEDD